MDGPRTQLQKKIEEATAGLDPMIVAEVLGILYTDAILSLPPDRALAVVDVVGRFILFKMQKRLDIGGQALADFLAPPKDRS